MKAVLVVGVATLDIVCQLPEWPGEDSETRALDLRQARGGNAANSAVVLAGLGVARVDWLGTLADDAGASILCDDFAAHGVGHAQAPRIADGVTPTSCVWLSRRDATRTIVHYRKLRELRVSEFQALALDDYDWIHFEGRDPPALAAMLDSARAAGARVSMEMEKPREGLDALWERADVLIFSRHYARENGFDDAGAWLDHVAGRAPRALSFCAWGERGAAWRAADGRGGFVTAPRVPCVDTLGAGDVFNAALIRALMAGCPPAEAAARGCRLAARKCTQVGFEGLNDD